MTMEIKYDKIVVVKKTERKPMFIEVDAERLIEVEGQGQSLQSGIRILEERAGGELAGKAFWLNPNYEWVLGEDEEGNIVLVPLRKE